MEKTLVSLEIYDNERTAFRTFEYIKGETGLSWSMYKGSPDEFGHTMYMIYGMFGEEDLECARNAVNEAET